MCAFDACSRQRAKWPTALGIFLWRGILASQWSSKRPKSRPSPLGVQSRRFIGLGCPDEAVFGSLLNSNCDVAPPRHWMAVTRMNHRCCVGLQLWWKLGGMKQRNRRKVCSVSVCSPSTLTTNGRILRQPHRVVEAALFHDRAASQVGSAGGSMVPGRASGAELGAFRTPMVDFRIGSGLARDPYAKRAGMRVSSPMI
ncbi:hypothetical protein VTI74DRAFT_11013 [Chaetomium olivicolor]